MPTPLHSHDLLDTTIAVIERTAAAWNIAPVSPRAVARRAPRGYVPVRTRRRLRAASTRTPCIFERGAVDASRGQGAMPSSIDGT